MDSKRAAWLVFVALAMLLSSACGTSCSGSSKAPDCSFFSNTCNPDIGPIFIPAAGISPSRRIVQVGMPVTFTASTNLSQPSYSWCRVPPSGTACATMPGETGASLVLASTDLSDNGAGFGVVVTGQQGAASSGYALLDVSSMPGVVFQDGEFLETDWSVSVVQQGDPSGVTFSAVRTATEGHPGAARSANYDFTIGPGSVRHFYSARLANYFPTTQGTLYLLDFAEDCIIASDYGVGTFPLIEQGGRRFIASNDPGGCGRNGWITAERRSLGREDFRQVDGPPCGATEACPDFSASAAPLRFGLVGDGVMDGKVPPGVVMRFGHRFDNWKVTAWRR